MDEIRIDNLEVYAYHGVFPEENEKGQPFFINAVLYTNTRNAGQSDCLKQSTHYGEVCHFITEWMQTNTYKLIESVAENVAREVLHAFPLIASMVLEVRKPEAPIGLPFQSVSVKINRGWHKAYIAFGSNLGEREQYIQQGIDGIKNLPDCRVNHVSEIITTKAYGGVEQDDFLNGLLELDTLLTPKELLKELHVIEATANRERNLHWGPRTLDLDIIYYDKLIYEDNELIIPHIDMQNRYFVLKPLAEIAPNYRHPILQKTTQELLSKLKNVPSQVPDSAVKSERIIQ